MKVTILGVMKGTTKGGNAFWNYFFQKEFTRYESENNDCLGLKVGEEFSYVDYDLKPGDVCDFQYEPGFQDKATLTDVIVLKEAVAETLKAKEGKS